MAKVSNGKIGSGRKITGVRVSSTQSAEQNEASAEWLRAQARTDPAYRDWEHTVKSRALPTSKAADVRKKFGERIHRHPETQQMLDEIAQLLAK